MLLCLVHRSTSKLQALSSLPTMKVSLWCGSNVRSVLKQSSVWRLPCVATLPVMAGTLSTFKAAPFRKHQRGVCLSGLAPLCVSERCRSEIRQLHRLKLLTFQLTNSSRTPHKFMTYPKNALPFALLHSTNHLESYALVWAENHK